MVTASPPGAGRIAMVVAGLFLVTGCVGTTSRDTFEAEIATRGGGSPERVWQEVAADLERRLGTDDLAVIEVSITAHNGFATIELRDPAAPDDVDRYYYQNGHLNQREPVRLSISDDLDATSFPIRAVRMDRLDEMADEALAEYGDEYGAEGRSLEFISIRRSSSGGDHVPVVTLSLTSPRSSAQATFDAQGRLLDLQRL